MEVFSLTRGGKSLLSQYAVLFIMTETLHFLYELRKASGK